MLGLIVIAAEVAAEEAPNSWTERELALFFPEREGRSGEVSAELRIFYGLEAGASWTFRLPFYVQAGWSTLGILETLGGGWLLGAGLDTRFLALGPLIGRFDHSESYYSGGMMSEDRVGGEIWGAQGRLGTAEGLRLNGRFTEWSYMSVYTYTRRTEVEEKELSLLEFQMNIPVVRRWDLLLRLDTVGFGAGAELWMFGESGRGRAAASLVIGSAGTGLGARVRF